MSGKITIHYRSDDAAAGTEVVVILPTFRRPGFVQRTLDSLAQQTTAQRYAVIVMENDAEGCEGLHAATPYFEDGRLRGITLVAHDRGNCSAYNAGLETALAEFHDMQYCMVIDDDEVASRHWIERMVDTSRTFDADVVGGPQTPVFEDPHGHRFRGHPVFRQHYAATGGVPILYSSGNMLMRRRVLDRLEAPYFDPAFNFIGGGDADLHSRCRSAGFTFAWCNEAPVYETMPARRTETSWLQARGLRNGAISSLIEHRRDPSLRGRAKTFLKTWVLLAAAPLRGIPLLLDTRSSFVGLYHLHVALGRFQAELGMVGEQYRKPEQN